MPDKTSRRIEAELAKTEDERLRTILNQGLDEWLRVYIVNQLKQISAQQSDPGAPERALVGMRYSIQAWKKARKLIEQMDVG
jgi:hypothetical protein